MSVGKGCVRMCALKEWLKDRQELGHSRDCEPGHNAAVRAVCGDERFPGTASAQIPKATLAAMIRHQVHLVAGSFQS